MFIRDGFDEEEGNDEGSATKETTKETTREILLKEIGQHPEITVRELALIIGLTDDGVRYHINRMRQEGILAREGSTKAGRWVILK